jgi:hypothetical protein
MIYQDSKPFWLLGFENCFSLARMKMTEGE